VTDRFPAGSLHVEDAGGEAGEGDLPSRVGRRRLRRQASVVHGRRRAEPQPAGPPSAPAADATRPGPRPVHRPRPDSAIGGCPADTRTPTLHQKFLQDSWFVRFTRLQQNMAAKFADGQPIFIRSLPFSIKRHFQYYFADDLSFFTATGLHSNVSRALRPSKSGSALKVTYCCIGTRNSN